LKLGIAEMPISISDSMPFQHSIIRNANNNARTTTTTTDDSSAMDMATGGDESDLN
jgi:hypothetical protein